jgi:hypothetical protein
VLRDAISGTKIILRITGGDTRKCKKHNPAEVLVLVQIYPFLPENDLKCLVRQAL